MLARSRMPLGLLVAAFASLSACTTTTKGTGDPDTSSSSSSGGSSGGTISRAECATRCFRKASSCSTAASSDVASGCSSFCETATAAVVDCLESKSCEELTSTSFAELCGYGSGGSSSSSSGTSGTSGGSSSSSSSSSGSSSTSSSSGGSDNNLGATCGDSFDCYGFSPCSCVEGEYAGALECIGTTCAPDCASTCELHGGT